MATHPGRGQFFIDGLDEVVQPGSALAARVCPVALGVQIGALFDQPFLVVVGRARIDGGLVLEVPAFPALHSPQHLGPVRARRAHAG